LSDPNAVSSSIIGAAIEVHRTLGPGLLESIYESALAYELKLKGHVVEQQKELPVIYKGVPLEGNLRLDMLVDGTVIVELKAIDQLQPIHEAQTLTYLKLSGLHLGLLINFNVPVLRQGIKRLVNNLPE
jgi:GxxExxY protein